MYQDNLEAQQQLDAQNTAQLQQLLASYGYPGKSLVGEAFGDYAAIVMIHSSDLDFQEASLPLLATACKNGEASYGVLKLLVDKIHWKKTGKQVFGSQIGVPFDEPAVVARIKAQYEL